MYIFNGFSGHWRLKSHLFCLWYHILCSNKSSLPNPQLLLRTNAGSCFCCIQGSWYFLRGEDMFGRLLEVCSVKTRRGFAKQWSSSRDIRCGMWEGYKWRGFVYCFKHWLVLFFLCRLSQLCEVVWLSVSIRLITSSIQLSALSTIPVTFPWRSAKWGLVVWLVGWPQQYCEAPTD